MANALVVRKTQLPQSQLARHAAQYVRMSTEYQRYSIENQAAVIATYARLHGLSIVTTYQDPGESGLRLKNRPGLIELLDDVQSGRANFGHILVYDVSRWGRFQDTDESAHYEFICKKAGIKVAYCAEQFDNDGTMMSSILKNLKRVMAAEFSRELSAKVHAGQLRLAALGFRVGGPLGYGLRRELIGENRLSKGYLPPGQQKNLRTDRVVLRIGTEEEIEVVRRIFREYVDHRSSEEEIVRRLNADRIRSHLRRPWTRRMVQTVLSNENFIGNTVYNRESWPLRERKIKNPPNQWIRIKGSMSAVVDCDLFFRAQRRLTLRWLHLSDDEMLSRLKALLERHNRLSEVLINSTLGVPSHDVYIERFGSLLNAYRLTGYQPKWDLDWIERKDFYDQMLRDIANDIAGRFEALGATAVYQPGRDVLTVSGGFAISLRLARSWKTAGKSPVWTIYRRTDLPDGWIFAARLDDDKCKAVDYLLLPAGAMTGTKIRFTETGRLWWRKYHFRTIELAFEAMRTFVGSVSKAKRTVPTKLRRPRRARPIGRPKGKAGCAQH